MFSANNKNVIYGCSTSILVIKSTALTDIFHKHLQHGMYSGSQCNNNQKALFMKSLEEISSASAGQSLIKGVNPI